MSSWENEDHTNSHTELQIISLHDTEEPNSYKNRFTGFGKPSPRPVHTKPGRVLWGRGDLSGGNVAGALRRNQGKIMCLGLIVMFTFVAVLTLTQLGKPQQKAKNVVILIGDGFGAAQLDLARAFRRVQTGNENVRLAQEDFYVGASRTRSASSLITDSAAGATAFSCSQKTNNRYVGVSTNGVACATLFEAAAAAGMSVGIVSSSRVTHATPAAFTSHSQERDNENLIAQQQLSVFSAVTGTPIHVVFGGGRRHFLPRTEAGSCRKDDFDPMQAAQSLGYNIISSKNELENAQIPVLGLFASSHLPFVLEYPTKPSVPTLAEMTQHALRLLSGHAGDKGFVLMVEGSRIDMAAHIHDSAGVALEVLSFQDAFDVVIDFAEDDENTLVVATADHETGGMSLGLGSEYVYYPEVLLNVRNSTDVLANAIVANRNNTVFLSDVVVRQWMGLQDASSQEIDELVRLADNHPDVNGTWPSMLEKFVSGMINQRARIGYGTYGHSGVDVPVFAFGPGAEEFSGLQENTDIGAKLFKALGVSVDKVQPKLRDLSVLDRNVTSFSC